MIPGVTTDTAGAVGVTAFGPEKPSLVTSFTDFRKTFGAATGLPLSVAAKGFFDNAGRRLVVKRAKGRGARHLRTALQALENVDEISILLAPGVWDPEVHDALIDHCER